MLALYKKQYVRFARVEEAERTLVYAVLLENNGREEIALSEPKLIRVILKVKDSSLAALPAGTVRSPYIAVPLTSLFVEHFFSLKIPHFSYARPPTK